MPLLKAISATVYCETSVPPPEVLNATVHLQFEPCPYLVMTQVTKPVAATELVMLYAIFYICVLFHSPDFGPWGPVVPDLFSCGSMVQVVLLCGPLETFSPRGDPLVEA